MATTNIGLETPAHGAEIDTWDVPLNDNAGKIDAAFGSVTTKSLTNVNVTLTATESRVNILRFTGTLTGNVQITLGGVIKTWTVDNQTLGNFVVTVTGGSGNVVGLPEGSCQITWDGTNVSFTNFKRVGEYWDDASADIPPWITACTVPPALFCNGSTFSAVTYPLLNKKLGGNTLPDQRGRFRACLDGGTGRITTAGGGVDGTARLASGGQQNRTIAHGNLPSATLTTNIVDPGHQHQINVNVLNNIAAGGGQVVVSAAIPPWASPSWTGQAGISNTGTTGITASTQLGGSGTALQTLPPTLMGGLTFIWAV